MNTPDAPNASSVVPHFEFSPGARYWVGELFGYLLDKQKDEVLRQFAAKQHLYGHFSGAVDVITVPSALRRGKTFQVFVWKPYAGKDSYVAHGLDTVFIQTNVGYFCIMPENEQKHIRDTIAKTIPAILNYPGGGYVTAPDCQPTVRNGKFKWGNRVNVSGADLILTSEHRRLEQVFGKRIQKRSEKPVSTKLSPRDIEIYMVSQYEEQPYSVDIIAKNKSGYKSAITLHFP